MKSQNKVLNFIAVAAIALPAVSPVFAQPKTLADAEGGAGPGGGNVVRNQLFDFYENNTVSADKELLQPALDNAKLILQPLAELIPEFPQALFYALAQKKIIFDSKVMNAEECLNAGSFFKVGKQIAACQNSFEVRIQREIFKGLNLKNRTGLIIHEALLAYRLVPYENDKGSWRTDRAVVETEIRETNRRIFDNAFSSVADANQQLGKLGFGNDWSSKKEVEFRRHLLSSYLTKMCDADNKVLVSREELIKIIHEGNREVFSGVNSIKLRDVWSMISYKAYKILRSGTCE